MQRSGRHHAEKARKEGEAEIYAEEGALAYRRAVFAEARHCFLRDAEGGAALNTDTDVDLGAVGEFHRAAADGAIRNGLTRVGGLGFGVRISHR